MRSTGSPQSETWLWEELARLRDDIDRLKLQVLDDASNLSSPAQARQITSPGYSEVFSVAAGTSSSVAVMFSADADAGTTLGRVQAIDVATNTVVFGPVDVVQGTGRLVWEMTNLPLSADPWRLIEIQAQRTSGTGTLTFRPYGSQGG